MTQIIFYIFGAMLLLSATMVVVIKNPIHAALFLVLSFFSSAAVWLLLNAEFLAIALVLVYVGAVMVLFLFVVMMLDINLATLREGFARYFPLGIIIALLMVIAMGMVVGSDYFSSDTYKQMSISATQSNTKLLGLAIYTDYLYQFEIAGAILLVAIIAAISLSMSKSKITKSTHPNEQVLAKKEDRLRIVKMKSEEKKG
jgi:NADH-quinone oxidoreductase subunit J